MERLELVRPSRAYAEAFLGWAREEILADPRLKDVWPSDQAEFATYLERWRDEENGPVPQLSFWLLRDGTDIVGSCRLRTRLNPELEAIGGHVDYGVRSTERRKGYGSRQLALLIEEARRRGMDRLLLTCRSDNLGSTAVILDNGGVFDGCVESSRSRHSRYWIDLR